MSLQYVRDYYQVPAMRGRRVAFEGRPGRITSADHRLKVLLDGDRLPSIIHPTEESLVYFGADGEQIWPTQEGHQP